VTSGSFSGSSTGSTASTSGAPGTTDVVGVRDDGSSSRIVGTSPPRDPSNERLGAVPGGDCDLPPVLVGVVESAATTAACGRGVAAGTLGATNTDAVTATAVTTVLAPDAAPPSVTNPGITPANHASGPITSRKRPREIARNARTTTGSNCVPALFANSVRAWAAGKGFLYERAAVMTSNASATATMRPASEIRLPRSPLGYPSPSQRSWCWVAARAHSPSHGRRRRSQRSLHAGCCRMMAHSS
jgi:hypothetical protein